MGIEPFQNSIDKFTSTADFIRRFDKRDEMWQQFVNYVKKDSIELAGVTEKQREALKRRLEAYLARFKWRSNGYFHVLNDEDAVINKARQVMKS